MARLGPSIFIGKTIQGRQSQRRTNPRSGPCYKRRLKERESPSLDHTVGDKRRPRPSESTRSEKPPKEYCTPPQARGLLSRTNTMVHEEELITINIDSSEQSRARLWLQPTTRRASSTSPDLWGWTPPRPTSGVGLRLARHRGRRLHLAQPLRTSSASPDPWVYAPTPPASEGGLRLT